jgi:hypothetical protein
LNTPILLVPFETPSPKKSPQNSTSPYAKQKKRYHPQIHSNTSSSSSSSIAVHNNASNQHPYPLNSSYSIQNSSNSNAPLSSYSISQNVPPSTSHFSSIPVNTPNTAPLPHPSPSTSPYSPQTQNISHNASLLPQSPSYPHPQSVNSPIRTQPSSNSRLSSPYSHPPRIATASTPTHSSFNDNTQHQQFNAQASQSSITTHSPQTSSNSRLSSPYSHHQRIDASYHSTSSTTAHVQLNDNINTQQYQHFNAPSQVSLDDSIESRIVHSVHTIDTHSSLPPQKKQKIEHNTDIQQPISFNATSALTSTSIESILEHKEPQLKSFNSYHVIFMKLGRWKWLVHVRDKQLKLFSKSLWVESTIC